MKTISTKRITKHIDDQDMYYVDSNEVYCKASTTCYYLIEPDRPQYQVSYHMGRMPAFCTEKFFTITGLATVMKDISGDLRRWHLVDYSEYV